MSDLVKPPEWHARRAPSAWRIEAALAAAEGVRRNLFEADPDLASDETLMRDLLDGETDVFDVLRRLVVFSLEANAMADAAGRRASDLAARKARYERRRDMARGAVLGMMDALGEKALPDAEFTATIRAGALGVSITDETLLPDEYVETTRKPKVKAIGDALKAETIVPGAELVRGMPILHIKVT